MVGNPPLGKLIRDKHPSMSKYSREHMLVPVVLLVAMESEEYIIGRLQLYTIPYDKFMIIASSKPVTNSFIEYMYA